MAEGNYLVGSIQFMDKIGIYDVVLPFLLVFVIVYAILEKTKVFGIEKVGKEEVSRKNLNAMAAFVIGFLVISSTSLVASISSFVANMVLLLILSVTFLLLVGSFTKAEDMKEGVFLKEKWARYTFMVIMFIGILIIFLNAMTAENNRYCGGECTWLEIAFNFVESGMDSSAVGSILLLLIVGGVIAFITWGGGKPSEEEKP